MKSCLVRELKNTDTEALLSFEVQNRAWFESHIDARDPSFYSAGGVNDHIEDYLSRYATGTWHPFVIESTDRQIIGRANLKDINPNNGCAEVGYRVAYQAVGQGIATQALMHLIQAARGRWKLKQLIAYVYPTNVGSKKVLGRCGFITDSKSTDEDADQECRFVLAL
ncbi:GNAT family N-acetyltransferase [Pseudomonas sp. NA-150]|uniref:GNAT family N-acetyltransferase n=1 Tax=Pseudomonas sp. NA-150 TaxID=3367525 RepID=UPI0037C6D37C